MTKVGNEMNARAILSSYTNVGTTNHQMSVHLNKYNSFHWFYFHFIISAIVVMHFFFSLKNLLLLSHRLDSGSVYLLAFSILSAIFLLRAVTTCTICVCVCIFWWIKNEHHWEDSSAYSLSWALPANGYA